MKSCKNCNGKPDISIRTADSKSRFGGRIYFLCNRCFENSAFFEYTKYSHHTRSKKYQFCLKCKTIPEIRYVFKKGKIRIASFCPTCFSLLEQKGIHFNFKKQDEREYNRNWRKERYKRHYKLVEKLPLENSGEKTNA